MNAVDQLRHFVAGFKGAEEALARLARLVRATQRRDALAAGPSRIEYTIAAREYNEALAAVLGEEA
jgi:hypothetical protein